MVEHGGHRASHACFLIELALICNLWQPYYDFSIVSTTAYLKSFNGSLWKTFTGLGPKEEYQAVLLGTWATINVTCYMFLILMFDFSKSYNDFCFQNLKFFKT